jgi:hypothetical protein
MKKNESENNPVADIVAEIIRVFVEILSRLIMFLLRLIFELIQIQVKMFEEYLKEHQRGYSKIDIRYVKKKHQSKIVSSLGVSLKSKKEILYKDLNTTLHSFSRHAPDT